jgi:hypothetical protein
MALMRAVKLQITPENVQAVIAHVASIGRRRWPHFYPMGKKVNRMLTIRF